MFTNNLGDLTNFFKYQHIYSVVEK